jgi:hypothetical protein
MNSLKRYFDGIIFLRMDRVRLIQKLVNEVARCVFYYMMYVIHYHGFGGFKCVLEIIMFEYDTGK